MKTIRSGLILLAFVAGGGLLMLWLAGKFSPKVPATSVSPHRVEAAPGAIAEVRRISVPSIEASVGTIRAVHETTIGSKLLARVVEVDLKAGQKVRSGDVLVRLDDTDLQAKLKQARAAVVIAEAAHAQALRDEERYASLAKSNAATKQDLERTATAVQSSEAELTRAREIVNEVQATLEWATIKAPMDGTVIDKKVDVGDLVTPGQPLVTFFDPTRMQLVASVRESLAHRLKVGQDIDVTIEGLNKQCTGRVSEIVPEAQASSRAFQVKVTGPCPEGIYSGMFGRVLIPLDMEHVLVVSRAAVHNVGQLELVDVVDGKRVIRRAVRTGRLFGKDIEILSGLREGDQVRVASAAAKEVTSHE